MMLVHHIVCVINRISSCVLPPNDPLHRRLKAVRCKRLLYSLLGMKDPRAWLGHAAVVQPRACGMKPYGIY